MNKMRYAFAILGLAAAPATHAAVLYGTFTPSDGTPETFDVDPVAILTSGSLSSYMITNDSDGADTLTVADGLFFEPGTAYVETSYGTGSSVTIVNKDFFLPSPQDDSLNLLPGVYSDSSFGSVLTLSAVPEPAAWALLIAGFGLVGGAVRENRRRQALATA